MNEIIKTIFDENDPFSKFPALISPRIITNILSTLEKSDKDLFDVRAEYPYNVKTVSTKDGILQKYVIEFALAGFKREDISVRVEQSKLLISTNLKLVEEADSTEKDVVKILHKGIAERSMKTYFSLGEGIDKKKIQTKFENGLLTIELPIKAEDAFEVTIS